MGKKGYYRLLNIASNASINEIKLAYRTKVKELHPDKNRNFDTTKEFQQLNEAYEILSDEIKRKDYDSSFLNELDYMFFHKEEKSETDFIKYHTNQKRVQKRFFT